MRISSAFHRYLKFQTTPKLRRSVSCFSLVAISRTHSLQARPSAVKPIPPHPAPSAPRPARHFPHAANQKVLQHKALCPYLLGPCVPVP